MSEDSRKSEEVVHYMDLNEFAKASESKRREMVKQMLVAIRRGGPDVDED